MKRLVPLVPGLAAAIFVTWITNAYVIPNLLRTVAIAAVIGSLAVSIAAQRQDVRQHAGVVFAIAAVVSAGQTKLGPFAFVFVAFAALLVACIRPLGLKRRPAPRRATVIFATTTLVVTGALVVGLPLLGGVIERRIQALIGERFEDSLGIASRTYLGQMHHMLTSDRVVFRVYGQPVPRLRGAVLDHYERRQWWSTLDGKRQVVAASAAEEAATTRIVAARGAVLARGPEARWFLPPNACDLHTTTGFVSVDLAGVAHPEPVGPPEEISLRTADCQPFLEAPPTKNDFSVPGHVFNHVHPIAVAWTANATTDAEKLAAIEHELSRFEYSMHVDWDYRIDPIVDFLERQKKGHCELFASSMVLAARSVGIPARVVTGYNVGEQIAGHAVVRERNAHMWVEAWVDGAWKTYDPTPPDALLAAQKLGRLEAVTEAISAVIDRVVDTVGVDGLLAIGAGIAAIVWGTRRFLLPLVGRRRARGLGALAPALPCFVALEAALVRAGHARDAAEPLERFARRIEATAAPWSEAVAAALRRYAALRYGGVGDEREIAREVERAAAAVTTHAA